MPAVQDNRLRGKKILGSTKEMPSSSSTLLVKGLAKKPRALAMSLHEELLIGEPPDYVEAFSEAPCHHHGNAASRINSSFSDMAPPS